MGVKSLWSLLNPVGRPVMLETIEGKALAIDSSIWIYQFQATMRDKEGRGLVNAHVLGFLRRISKLLFYGIKPVFVFDGGAPALKRSTIVERKKKKLGAAADHARIAEKLLAAHMRREAVKHVQSKSDKGKGKQSQGQTEVVYLEDIDPNASPSKPKSTPSPAKKEKPKFHDHDPYALPSLDLSSAISKVMSSSSGPDPRLATEEELRSFTEDLRPEDLSGLMDGPKGVDVTSASFRALPTELQYEIIGDLRLKSRQTSFRRLELMLKNSPTPLDFSRQQIKLLKQRNELTQQLLTTTDSIGQAYVSIPVRIASERNKQYVLVKNEGKDGGWILGIKNEEGTMKKPIEIDCSDGEDDMEMEEVRIPDRPYKTDEFDPDLREHRQEMALSAIAGRSKSGGSAQLATTKASSFSTKPIKPTKSIPLFTPESDDEDGEPMPSYSGQQVVSPEDEDEELLSYAIQASLDDATATTYTNVFADSMALDNQPDLQDHASPMIEPSRLETALSIANASPRKVSGPFTSNTIASKSIQNLLQRKSGSERTFSVMNTSGSVVASSSSINNTATASDNEEESVEITTRFIPSNALLSSSEPIADIDEIVVNDEDDDIHMQEVEIIIPTPPAGSPSQHEVEVELVEDSSAVSAPENELPHEPPQLQSHAISSTPLSSPLLPVVPPVSFSASPESDEDEDMQEIDIADAGESLAELPSLPPPLPANGILHIAESLAIHDALLPTPPSFSAEVEQPNQDDEENLLHHNDEPGQVQDQQYDQSWDAAQEMDAQAEQTEFASFFSEVANKDLDSVRREIDDEIKTLNDQRKAAMRDSEDVTQAMINQIMMMLRLFGIPYITAPMEAEAQCAELASLGLVEGVITDDSDVFLFGTPPTPIGSSQPKIYPLKVYKNMFNQSKTVEVFHLTDLSRELGLDRNALIRLAYLLGSDYTEGLPGVGPVLAMELLREFPGDDGLFKFKDWWSKVQTGRDKDDGSAFKKRFKKKFKDLYLLPEWPNGAVRDAYYHPLVDSSEEPFKWGLPDLDALRTFFHSELGWQQIKVDELLLPIIQKMNKRTQAMALNRQGTLANFFEGATTSAGGDVFSGGSGGTRKRNAYASKRLQKVVADYRREQLEERRCKAKGKGSVSSSRASSAAVDEIDGEGIEMKGDVAGEPPKKKARIRRKTTTATTTGRKTRKATASGGKGKAKAIDSEDYSAQDNTDSDYDEASQSQKKTHSARKKNTREITGEVAGSDDAERSPPPPTVQLRPRPKARLKRKAAAVDDDK